ncbi:hypothetical protein SAMN03159338_1922 [Sphingomonas sp. NFR04]|uniref:hypothetical protein n=1 Tax=Sphingomonas sp. NFR04 TaxID=1566283 RepID=UPI0008DEF47A|nr:hypothetical protein [Sphingomonas sp. NFR04]SFJ60858.1 hypothetical protein SAMN03159338_1922 [Sphingomonas sp. NFR04]
MDLAYLLSRYEISVARAGSAACVSARASHRALASGYAERIRRFRMAGTTAVAA